MMDESKKKKILKTHGEITILEHKNATKSLEFTLWPQWPDRIISYIMCPKCNQNILISTNHTVTINQNGKVTINPSVLHVSCGAHFWVSENCVTHI